MEQTLSALIVDDEELARIGLRLMLEKCRSIKIAGEASNITEAAEAALKLKPDVIFLDIEFPGESGFDLLNKIDSSSMIVFVTAFDEFAIRAFEINACDYLLKPVNSKRLDQTISRLLSEKRSSAGRELPLFNYDDQIFLEVNYKYYFVKINSIIRISAAGKYSELLTANKLKGLTKKSMQEWESCLPKNKFIRIHRSTIINVESVDKIVKDSHSSFIVYMKGSEEKFYISRRYASQIKDFTSV